jgi:uncharacterized protein
MILIDVHILVHAKRQDSPNHANSRSWLEKTYHSDSIIGISDHVLSSVVRILTHEALDYVNSLRGAPGCILVSPGYRHREIFTHLCNVSGDKGNLVTDAYFAALAIESGAEWITADRDFSRFPGLRWRHPLS